MEDDFDEYGEVTVNYQNVLKQNDFMAVTRLLAANLISEPYMTMRDFLIGLSDRDLKELLEILDSSMGREEDTDPRMEEAVLIVVMLSQAEGLSAGDSQTVTSRLNAFAMILAIESLFRKKLVKIFRENMTLGEDYDSKIICEKI
jgi:hypothetical protein